MRKLFALLFSISFFPAVHAQDPDSYDKEKLLDSFFSIVMIRGYNENGGLSYGSGIVVAKDKVLTNCHIFRQTKQPWISRGEDTYTITSFQADRYHDICLVSAENMPFKPVLMGNGGTLKKGQDIVSIGYSNGMNAPLTSLGTVQSVYEFDHGNVVRASARFVMGASGSGLFDTTGHLLGINTIKTPGNNAYYYSLPLEWLEVVAQQPVETKFPVVGKTFWEEQDAQKPYFMQMAEPEIQENWTKLQEVAANWTTAEPKSSEAWYELGLANDHLNQAAEAEKAYRKAVALNTQNTDALFRIGVIAAEKGDKAEMHAINLTLLDINKEIAESFSKTVGCGTQC